MSDVIDTLRIEIEADSTNAENGIDRLINTLERFKKTVAGDNRGLGSLTKRLQNFSNTLTNFESGSLSKLNTICDSISNLSSVSKVRLSNKLPEQIVDLGVAVDCLKDVDFTKLNEMAEGLSALKGVGGVKVPSIGDNTKLPSVDSPVGDMNLNGSVYIESETVTDTQEKVNALKSTIEKTGNKAREVSKSGKKAAGEITPTLDLLKSKLSSFGDKFKNLQKMFSRRIMYRAMNALISAITTGFKEGLGNVYQYSKALNGTLPSSLDRCATSSNYLKNSIGAMAAPLVNIVTPYVEIAIDKFVDLLNIINQVFARLSGATTWTRAEKVMVEYAKATDAATKANEKLKKAMLGIDELNVIPDKASSPSGGSSSDVPTYSFVEEAIDNEAVDGFLNTLESILTTVGAIALGFKGWQIGSSLAKSIAGVSAGLSMLGGILLADDLSKLIGYIKDISANGANFTNVSGVVAEGFGIIGDVLIIFGETKIGGAFKVAEGLVGIISDISDIAENGINWDNALSAVDHLSDIAIGIGLFTGHLDVAGWGIAIKGFTNIINEIADNWEAIKNGDWSGINWGAMVIGAIEVIGGVAMALGAFSKIKSAANIGKVATDVGEVATATETVSSTTSALTSKLTSLVKDLALGIAILAEIAVAVGIVVGSVYALGLLLEQVGIAWQPVLDNGVTVTAAMIIGTALFATIGGLTAVLGTAGSSLIVNIALGTAMLAELGVATGLFIAEIWAIGWGLDQVGIAWQPVLDNGENIAIAIGIGTGLLIAIGVVTALLGVAAVASAGLLPLAIGLGTAMLVELGVAAGLFIIEIWAIGEGLDKIGEAWQPVLKNGDTISQGIKKGTELLIAIGIVTAALGVASVTSVGLLPVAIGLGTSLLIKLSDSVLDLNDSLVNVADSLSNKLHPALDNLNGKLPSLSNDMKNFTGFMQDFAGNVVSYTKSNAISGFSATVDTIIGWFTKDPVEKLADDANKQYKQARNLNEKLRQANPELETANKLLQSYYDFLREIERLTGKNTNINLASGMLTNMKEVGKNLVIGFVDGIKSKTGDLGKEVKNVLKDTLTEKTAKSYGKDFGKYIGKGISEGLKGSWFPTLSGEVNVKSSGKVSLKLQAYAMGGFPDAGQLFIAREAGAEMVGSIGGKTAVANNDQIVESVSSGVYQAVRDAMREENNNGNSRDGSPMVVKVDGKTLFEIMVDQSRRETVRTGNNPLLSY